MKSKLKEDGYMRFLFWCPGCEGYHSFNHHWKFDGNMDKPTVSPSLLVNAGRECPSEPRCHLFLRNGVIQFLSDCTHDLAGQSVPLEEHEWLD